MMKRHISLLIILTMLIAPVYTSFAAETADAGVNVIYVAPYGNDTNPGTIDSPLGTLQGAVDAVRASKDTDNPITEVVLRGGDYHRTDNVEFTAADSGTSEKPIIYRAYEGETPRLLGSAPVDVTGAVKVTDSATLARLHPDAVGKLVQIDLAAQGFTKDDICDTSLTHHEFSLVASGDNYNSIYIDGYEQELAQWPNGRGNFTTWEKTVSNYVIQYREDEPSRWVNAKNWWINAYPDYDYQQTTTTVESIDPIAKTITFISKALYPYTNPYSKRWKAFNLLEELDVPGEFYIDRDALTLYLYPPYTLKAAKVTLGVVKPYIMTVTNTQNVVFEGLTFAEARHSAVRIKDIRNVDFINCDFTNISNHALMMSGSKTVQTVDKEGYQRNGCVDAAYDVDVRGCVFDVIGHSAITVQGGNIDTLTPSNNVIEDCYFSRTNLRYFQNSTIWLMGCGTVLRNNVFTNTRQYCINIYGNNNIIEGNELYDAIREVGDAGAIYVGGTSLYRGNHIRRNFIHNVWPADPNITAGNIAIYQDEGSLDNYMYENIIYDCKRAYNNNWSGEMTFKNNIIIDCPSRWAFHDYRLMENEVVTENRYGSIQNTVNLIADKDLFFKAYPKLKEWALKGRNPKMETVVSGNLIVGESSEYIGTQEQRYSTFENNVVIPETSDFVDVENLDFRVKSGSALKEMAPGVLDDTFDINLLGMKNPLKFDGTTSPFRLISPKSGYVIPANDITLRWQEPFGANEYRVQVAKDKGFTNIVYDETVRYARADIGDLEKGKTYYWKVTAVNTSRQSANSWEHDGAVFSFTTGLYEELDLRSLDGAIATAESEIANNVEGSTAGTFKVGSADKLRNYIEVTKDLTSFPLGRYTQRALNSRLNYIRNFYNNSELVNRGYVDLSQYMKAGMWTNSPVIEDESVYVLCPTGAGALVSGIPATGPFSGSSIYCFDITVNPTPDKEYISLGMSKNPGTLQYNKKNNGYYLIIKEDLVELQRNDGSGPFILEVKEGVTLFDGKKHSMRFGVINTSLGCNIIVVVDGEVWFSYADVSTLAQTSDALSFATGIRTEGANALFQKSENIPDSTNFENLLLNLEYNNAKAVAVQMRNAQPGISRVRLFKAGTNKAITEDGVYDISYAPTEMKNNYPMVPASLVARIFDSGDAVSGEKANLNIRSNVLDFTNGIGTYSVNGEVRNATVTPYMKNGHLMVSLQDIADALGIQLMVDIFNDVILLTDTGSVTAANQAKELQDAAAMLEKLSKFSTTQDVFYKDLKFN